MKMSSTSSDDEILGTEAEQEYERSLDRAALAEQTLEEPAPVKKPKSKSTAKRQRLTNAQRLSLIDGFRQGKTDKFFNVIPNKNKPGDYRIVRRRKPLDVPISDNTPDPIKIETEPPQKENIIEKPVKEKKEKFHTEFYTMQNTINNSLSKEIAAVMEKCNKIEAKMKKQKQKMREQRNVQRQYIPDDYVEEYVDDDEPQEEPEYRYYPRYGARRRIDLRNFG